jgi:hypothetical protein
MAQVRNTPRRTVNLIDVAVLAAIAVSIALSSLLIWYAVDSNPLLVAQLRAQASLYISVAELELTGPLIGASISSVLLLVLVLPATLLALERRPAPNPR